MVGVSENKGRDMTAALCSTRYKYKDHEKNQYSLQQPKIKMYYKQKKAISSSGKKQGHSIGNHWLKVVQRESIM